MYVGIREVKLAKKKKFFWIGNLGMGVVDGGWEGVRGKGKTFRVFGLGRYKGSFCGVW